MVLSENTPCCFWGPWYNLPVIKAPKHGEARYHAGRGEQGEGGPSGGMGSPQEAWPAPSWGGAAGGGLGCTSHGFL